MNDKTLKLLEDLTQLQGVPGFEDDVRAFVQERLAGVAEFETDNLGSLVCKKEGESTGPKIIVPAHIDEIGFMVKDITEGGYLRFSPLGGWLDQTLLGHVVTVQTREGDLQGVIGCKPPHLVPREDRNKVIKRKAMFIDVGARDKEHAEELGVRIGDPVVPEQRFSRIGDGKHLLSKAWDDRVGVALMIDLLEALRDTSHPNTVYGVATTQEEVGTRGAKTAAAVVDPDFCIVLDVGLATDMPGVEGESKVEFGKGAILYALDAGTIAHHRFNRFAQDIADREEIPYQLSLMELGGTDARPIHLHARGVPSLLLGIPSRYIHSHAGLIHTDDYDLTLALLIAVIRELSPDRAKELLA